MGPVMGLEIHMGPLDLNPWSSASWACCNGRHDDITALGAKDDDLADRENADIDTEARTDDKSHDIDENALDTDLTWPKNSFFFCRRCS